MVARLRRFASAPHLIGKQSIRRIDIEDQLDVARSIAFGMLWVVVLIGDLRQRRVPIPVLLALMILSLVGQAWPWWLLAGGMLLWPSRRSAIVLAPIALCTGVVTNSPAPAMAIAAGSAAWALGWWGGADSIALLVLGLWHGLIGLIVGAIATAIAGLLVMVFRRRAFIGLLSVLPEAIAWQARDSVEIPAEAEMPAAAALAVPGMLLSACPLIILLTRGPYA
jgi:Flp pilus assembly protein protease CpaA